MRDFTDWRGVQGEMNDLPFRIRPGTKQPRTGDHEDMVIEWLTPLGWRPMGVYAPALMLEFMMWNEDGLYPRRDGYKGYKKLWAYLMHTRDHDADKAEAGLRAERDAKRNNPPDTLFDAA